MTKLKADIGWGTSDSWGFSIAYCHYAHSLSIEFIHWYAYIEVWKKHN